MKKAGKAKPKEKPFTITILFFITILFILFILFIYFSIP